MSTARSGATSPRGFNFTPDIDVTVVTITLANGASLLQGQVVCRDMTQIPSAAGADIAVKPSSTNAGFPIGVYQGATITNNTGVSQTYDLEVQVWGWGVVSAQAKFGGVAVKVGDSLILNGTDDAPISGTAALNVKIGQAVATGAVTAKAATIITVPGSGATVALVNCFIYIS